MRKGKFLLLFCLCFWVSLVFGFSSRNTITSRTFDKLEAVVGEPITVTVRFTNGEANVLRGFYYAEQIPQGLQVNRGIVKINGTEVSCLVESGSSGEVFAGSVPYRWVLETPPGFAEDNPISQNSTVEIVYSVSSSQAGAFAFDEFNWVGYYQSAPEGMRAAFGHSEDVDKRIVTFKEASLPPAASFSGSPRSGGAPLTVSFTDLSTGVIDKWSWSFGDGGTSTEQNPTYTYNTPGSYTVTLEVTGAGGTNTRVETAFITVTPPAEPPVASFSGSPRSGGPPLAVSFTDSSTGVIDKWSWSFGDGGTSTEQNPTYTYNTPGTYSVTLTITGPGGIAIRTETAYVSVVVAVPPASRSFDRVDALVGESITIKVSFINRKANNLGGFYYTEHIPEGLRVNAGSVKINGTDVPCLVEAGSSGEVYPGAVPYRWVLETPPGFAEKNPISPNSAVEIVYSVTSSGAGAFNLNEFNWVGYYQSAAEGMRAAFGYSEEIDKQTITFTAAP
jgi:PKD repeat protein